METERRDINELPKPPVWWHEAIRNNFAGMLTNPDLFETFEETTADGVSYTIYSVTSNRDDNIEGVYIAANISNIDGLFDQKLLAPVVEPLRLILRKKALSRSENSVVSELGVTISLESSFYLMEIAQKPDAIVFSLIPLYLEKIDESSKILNSELISESVINHYFEGYTYLQRLKFVSSEILTDPLRKAILKKEFVMVNDIIEESGGYTTVENYDDLRSEFKILHDKIANINSDAEAGLIEEEFVNMDFSKLVGWNRFLKEYWEEKLGPLS
jgi:hypothetical protein